jgi:hypothetical protein
VESCMSALHVAVMVYFYFSLARLGTQFDNGSRIYIFPRAGDTVVRQDLSLYGGRSAALL